MSSKLLSLIKSGLIKQYPSFIKSNLVYETFMGSRAYEVQTSYSDIDIYAVVVPPKKYIFAQDKILGFDDIDDWKQDQWHSIQDAQQKKEYDITCYSLVRYFYLLLENNPNILDSLFTKYTAVTHSTTTAQILRNKRKIFLHKGCYHRLVNYAHDQLKKAAAIKQYQEVLEIRHFEEKHDIPHSTKYDDVLLALERKSGTKLDTWPDLMLNQYKDLFDKGLNRTKRFAGLKTWGQDNKFLYNLARLSSSAEQILRDQDLDITLEKEYWKAIRRGDISHDEIVIRFMEKEKYLTKLFETSTLREKPDKPAIRILLLECLEHHYGTLEKCVYDENRISVAFKEIIELVDKNRSLVEI